MKFEANNDAYAQKPRENSKHALEKYERHGARAAAAPAAAGWSDLALGRGQAQAAAGAQDGFARRQPLELLRAEKHRAVLHRLQNKNETGM